MKRGGLEESFGRIPRETDELTEEEGSSDYTRVLITVNGCTGYGCIKPQQIVIHSCLLATLTRRSPLALTAGWKSGFAVLVSTHEVTLSFL